MFDTLPRAVDDLDGAATLAAIEGEVVARRAAEARDLALAAHWADLHAADPQRDRDGQRAWHGESRLIEIGGDGTPMVQDLCLAELAIARRVHHHAARAVVADALDLRHRLPRWWHAVQTLHLEPWVARKAAALSRPLDQLRVMVIDAALPDDLAEISPGRLLDIVRAQVIEADPARHARLLDDQLKRRYVSLSQTDELGLRHVIARVRAGDAVWVDAMVERIADLIADRFPTGTTRDVLRSEAFGWLARPEELLALLHGTESPTRRQQAVLLVHLSEAALGTDNGVARVEDIGPILTREVPEWLRHCHVTVHPVIDLHDQVAVDAYEHPTPCATASPSARPPTASPTPTRSPAGSTSTTSNASSRASRARRATTTPNRSAARDTAPRPTTATASDNSGQASTSGEPPTASPASSTTAAPPSCPPAPSTTSSTSERRCRGALTSVRGVTSSAGRRPSSRSVCRGSRAPR
jgi:hypothetical protein